MTLSEATFWEHAEDLRKTVIRSLLIIAAGLVLSLYFYQDLFQLLTSPLNHMEREEGAFRKQEIHFERIVNGTSQSAIYRLPENAKEPIRISENALQIGQREYSIPPQEYLLIEKEVPHHPLIILGPIEGMLTMLKVCFWCAVISTSPLWLFLLLRFISPALEVRHRLLIFPFLGMSLLFLSAGILFGFYITIPIANQYLSFFNQSIGTNLWSLTHYLDYSVFLLLANGLAFELAVILFFLVHYRMISVESLVEKRRHMIVAAFIIGAILTPPDVLTQLMLAIPLIGFYELIILYGRMRRTLTLFNYLEQQLQQ